MNPPKFDMCEDMSGLTYLNDASVLWNLTARYVEKLIYVSQMGIVCLIIRVGSSRKKYFSKIDKMAK